MFGDMFGNMEEQQRQMAEKLGAISLTAEAGDGAVTVTATALRTITNISIDPAKVDLQDKEQLEDLLVVAINDVLEKAATKEAAESKKMLNDLLPPGLSGMFGG